MGDARSGSSYLLVRKLRAQYLVSTNHPAPERVKARLDETIAKDLPATLSVILSRWFSSSDSSIWLIKRLELEVDLNVARNREQVAIRWAARIARDLVATLQSGEDGQNVLRFPDRAAYLARFLIDLANGRAWSKWYYESFDGLRILPTSAAIRTAVCDELEMGLDALLKLTSRERVSVLQMLTAQDTRRIVNSLAVHSSNKGEQGAFLAVWRVWEAAQLDPLQIDRLWYNTLQLYLAACAEDTQIAGPALQTAVQAMLCLARCLPSLGTPEAKRLHAALTGRDLAAIYLIVGSADAGLLDPFLKLPADWINDVVQTFQTRYSNRAAAPAMPSAEQHHTPFGGLFLLLPLLDALPLAEASHDWPQLEGTNNTNWLRFLILIKCLGQFQARRVFGDPLVRELLGLDPDLGPATIARWQAGISPGNLTSMLETMSHWHREKWPATGLPLMLVRIPLPGASVAVLLDAKRGIWLAMAGYHPRHLDRLLVRFQLWLHSATQDETPIITDTHFHEALKSRFPHLTILDLNDDVLLEMVESDKMISGILARLEKTGDDLSFVTLPKSFRLTRPFDQALSVVAQGLMRDFAWRLPGFAGSTLPYLYHNFLDFQAVIEEEPDRWVVRLGQPPLNLILNMTGLNRQTFTPAWRDGRPFVLFQGG